MAVHYRNLEEGVSGGGWLRDTECVLQNRVGTFLGRPPGAALLSYNRIKNDCHKLNQHINIVFFCYRIPS